MAKALKFTSTKKFNICLKFLRFSIYMYNIANKIKVYTCIALVIRGKRGPTFVRSSITIIKILTGKRKVTARNKPQTKTAAKSTKYNMFALSVF